MFVWNEVKVCDGCILSTCVLLQGVLPLLAAQQHHQLHHGGGRLERVDGLGWRRIKGGGVAVKPRAL